MNITEYEQIVKEQISYLDFQLTKSPSNKKFQNLKKDQEKLLIFLASLADLKSQSNIQPSTNEPPDLGNRIGSIEDLPPELRKEIKVGDEMEDKIISVIKHFEGIASIDELLVGIYRQHKKLLDRRKLSAKMHRMHKKGLIETVEGKRGFYQLSGHDGNQQTLNLPNDNCF